MKKKLKDLGITAEQLFNIKAQKTKKKPKTV